VVWPGNYVCYRIRLFRKFLDGLELKLEGEILNIPETQDLRLLTELAEAYGALPRFSKAVIVSSLTDKPKFLFEIPQYWREILRVSAKLREKVLFRECVIHAIGPWTKPEYLDLGNRQLKGVVKKAEQRILSIIEEFFKQWNAHKATLRLSRPVIEEITLNIKKGIEEVYTGVKPRTVCFPTYLRSIQEKFEHELPDNLKA
jgi:hypothetical protein